MAPTQNINSGLLQKVGLADVVIGLGLLVVGMTEGPSLFVAIGIALAVSGAGMFLFARSQRQSDGGPIS